MLAYMLFFSSAFSTADSSMPCRCLRLRYSASYLVRTLSRMACVGCAVKTRSTRCCESALWISSAVLPDLMRCRMASSTWLPTLCRAEAIEGPYALSHALCSKVRGRAARTSSAVSNVRSVKLWTLSMWLNADAICRRSAVTAAAAATAETAA